MFSSSLLLVLALFANSAAQQLTADRTSDAASEYEKWQGSKLSNNTRIEKWDRELEKQLRRRFAKQLAVANFAYPVLCVGARLGGEVRAFRALAPGQLAIGVDFNPGPRNPWVMWGDAHQLMFDDHTFGTVYVNILDHVANISQFADEARRVLRPGGTLMVDMDMNVPDEYSVHDLKAEHQTIVANVFAPRFEVLSSERILRGERNSPKRALVMRRRPRTEDRMPAAGMLRLVNGTHGRRGDAKHANDPRGSELPRSMRAAGKDGRMTG